MPGPFDGIRVLDLSQVVSGPLATMLLSDQGAEVTKIEPLPGTGTLDSTRLPVFMKGGISALYVNNNRGKRAITLDVRRKEGLEIALEMAAKADVFVQNFRPGAADRLGLGYDDVRRVNPDIVYVSISGYGPTGPYAQRPVYDPIIQGLSGMVMRQTNPEIPVPDLVRNLVADKTTALTTAQAIAAALFHRERTGEGQHVEIPMIDSFLYFFWPDGMMDGTLLDEDASGGFILAEIYSLTPTSDGRIIYFTASDQQRLNLFRALGHPEWGEDPRFATIAASATPENAEKLGALINNAFLELTSEEAMTRLLENDVPCGVILDTHDVPEDAQILHNEVLETWTHPQAGQIRQPRPAARFSASPAALRPSASPLGGDNDAVLTELGRSASEIAALREKRVVG